MRDLKDNGELNKGLLKILEYYGSPLDMIEAYDEQNTLFKIDETPEENNQTRGMTRQ